MNAWIGSDSLAFISLDGLRAAVPDARHQGFCDACFTGDYPVAIPERDGEEGLSHGKSRICAGRCQRAQGAKGTRLRRYKERI